MCAGAALMVPIGIVTLFRARRLYAACATAISRAVLRLYGIRMARARRAAVAVRTDDLRLESHVDARHLHPRRARAAEYAVLPQRLPPQDPAARHHQLDDGDLLHRAADDRTNARASSRARPTLKRTRESVYLSPEGERVTTGTVGHFNKGAFHLATELHAPIVPMFLFIPPEVDPKRGLDARPGTVHVYVLPAVDTRAWVAGDSVAEQGTRPRSARPLPGDARMRVMPELLRDRAQADPTRAPTRSWTMASAKGRG